MDPFGVWWVPIPLIHVFFSMSWPIHLSSCSIVVFFWWDLVAKTKINIRSGFLTAGKYPAAVMIVIMCLVEYSTAALRAAGFYSSFLNLNAAIYVVVLIILISIYCYVFALVFKFFRRSPVLRAREEVLKAVSLRFLMSAVTFLLMIVFGCLTLTSFFFEAVGQSIVHFLIFTTTNAGSTCTLSAFALRPGINTKSGDATVNSRTGAELENSRSLSLSLSSLGSQDRGS